jgi:hypothetical protein
MQGRLFVKEDRNLQLCSYPLPQSLCQMDTILHRRAAQWYERHDVRRPHSRVDALVLPKIDEIGRHANCAKGGFNDGVRFAGKAQDRAMVIPIHQGTHRLVSPLTEIRHALDDSIHVHAPSRIEITKPEV